MVDLFKTHDDSDSTDESSLKELLREACDVPPVPDALLRRMDRNVEAVWGESPKLQRIYAGPVRRVLLDSFDRISPQTLRTLSLTTVAAIACVATCLFVTRDRYSWAGMIDRLQQEPVLRITEAGLNKVFFVSAGDEVIAERTQMGTHVTDFRRRVEFDYRTGDEVVVQTPLAGGSGAPQPGAGLLRVLLRGTAEQPESTAPFVVESESWRRVIYGGRKQVELRTRLVCANQPEPLQVVSLVDPETCLPSTLQFRTRHGAGRRLSIDRVAGGETVLAVAGLPQELPIVAARVARVPADSSVVLSTSSSLTVEAANTLASGSRKATSVGSGQLDHSKTRSDVVTGSINLEWDAVLPISISATEVAGEIDRLLSRAWRASGVTPAAPADSGQLMRRIYLDLTGRIPTVSEVRGFEEVANAPGAADALIEQLLESMDYSSHVAAVWRGFLMPDEAEFDATGDSVSFDEWFVEQLENDAPYDQIVRSLLVAEGRLAESGPLLFYSAAKLEPEKLAGRSARAFLGMRLECAQCHDDPFEPWTQNDFWSFAAYFARISRPQGQLDLASPVMLVRDVEWGDVKLPESDTVVAPRLLDGTSPDANDNQSLRQQLAEWLTARENPFFARATVNRVWSLMFGRGIVDPVDGFGSTNQADVPEVLDLLAGYFVASDFDLRALYRAIARTKAYRLSSGGDIDGSERQRWFAQMHVKVLSAAQLYDSIAVATLVESSVGANARLFSLDRIGNESRQQFVEKFDSSVADTRAYQGGIPLALTLMNGSLIKDATGIENSGLLNAIQAPFFSTDQRVRVLFLATVAREPTAAEWDLCRSHLEASGIESDEFNGLADILWALLNGAEFTMNH